jgi:hypothetical protein
MKSMEVKTNRALFYMGFVADITTQNSEHKDILILDRTKCWTYTKTQENMSPCLKSTGDQDDVLFTLFALVCA